MAAYKKRHIYVICCLNISLKRGNGDERLTSLNLISYLVFLSGSSKPTNSKSSRTISNKNIVENMRCVCDEVPSSSVRYVLPASYIVPHFQDTSYIQIVQWGPKRAICGSHHFDNISLMFEQGK